MICFINSCDLLFTFMLHEHNRCSLMSLNKMVAPLRMEPTLDGLPLIRMIVSCMLFLRSYFVVYINILTSELLVAVYRYKRSPTLLQTRKRPNHKRRSQYHNYSAIQQIQSIRRRQTQILRRCQTHSIWYGTGLEQILFDWGNYRIQCKVTW